jgi:glycosyltransferase involved in cell wall biosynthesis
MIQHRQKLTFISHEASLTGAPILFLNLLTLIGQSDIYDITILLYRGGPLEKEFKKIAPVYVLKQAGYGSEKRWLNKAINYCVYRVRKFISLRHIKNSDLIINNTVATGSVVKDLHDLKIPVITYVHELQSVIDAYIRIGSVSAIRYSDYFMVPARVVADNLVEKHGVSREKIFHLNYFIPAPVEAAAEKGEPVSKSGFRASFFQQYGIPGDKFYVAGMGTITYRKGFDLFIEACMKVHQQDKNIFFVWIGGFEEEETRIAGMDKINEYGIGNTIRITGRIPHSPFNLLPFDLFLMTSREDPYPLVVIEAGQMRLPAICFSQSGGAPEFLAGECGWILKDFNTDELAEKIIQLKNDPAQIKERGLNAFEKAMNWHSNGAIIAEQFNGIVKKVLQ